MSFQPLSRPVRMIYRAAQILLTCDVSDLMILDLDDIQLRKLLPDGCELFRMTPDLLREHATNTELGLNPLMAYRLLFGRDVCIGIRNAEGLLGYAWFALGSIEAENNRGAKPATGTAISFPAQMAFMYNVFILPKYRGQGLYAAMVAYAFVELNEFGVRQILVTTDWANNFGLKACYAMGFRRVGRMIRFGVGRAVLGWYPRAARRLGVRCGNWVNRKLPTPAYHVMTQPKLA